MFLVELDALDVVKDVEEVSLYGVRVTGLTQNLQEGWVRHEEEAWE